MLCWKPSRKFFFEFAKENFLFAKVSRKLDIMNHDHYHCIHCSLFRATTSCPPGARGPAGEWYRTFTYPFIDSNQASSFRRWGFATAKYHGLEAHPCTCRWYCLALLSEVSRNKLQTQQPSFQKWGFARAKHQGPWCLRFLWCAPCWWLGSADRGIFCESSAKVLRRTGRKSKCILKGVAQ